GGGEGLGAVGAGCQGCVGPAEWSHIHPSGACPGGRVAMTVPSGAGLLSQFFERGGAGSGCSSSPGAWRPSGLSPALFVRRGCGGGLRRCTFGVGEQVPGAGEELAGDRGGGDLLAAPRGDGPGAGGALRGAPRAVRVLAPAPP